jgi:hypothetical protein
MPNVADPDIDPLGSETFFHIHKNLDRFVNLFLIGLFPCGLNKLNLKSLLAVP